MSDRVENRSISPALLPEHDEHVDDAVALGRGDLAGDAATRVRQRMLHDPIYRGVVEPIVRAYDEPPLSAEDAEIGWPNLVRASGLPESVVHAAVGTPDDQLHRRRKYLVRLAGRAAAVLVLLLGLHVGQFYGREAYYYDTIRTSNTETVIRTLPDGTVATIGPASELKFPAVMLPEKTDRYRKRTVWPKGEVTFEVPHVPSSGQIGMITLMVETPHAWITVLGARLKVTVLETVTELVLEEGAVLARKKPRGPDERTPPVLPLKAPASATFTRTGYGTMTRQVKP